MGKGERSKKTGREDIPRYYDKKSSLALNFFIKISLGS
jgi:hypothetical protein